MKRLMFVFLIVIVLALPSYAFRMAASETNQFVYFVAVDATDLKTRETGLNSFTVYYSINSGAGTVMTTPTVAETNQANMPGVYDLLIDEAGMTTLTAGDDTVELCLHITHAGMDPVTRVIEIYRPETTLGETLTVDAGDGNADIKEVANINVPVLTSGMFSDSIDIGAGGVNLSDLGGMSTAMKAEIEVEANDALVAVQLDHLVGVTTGVAAAGDLTAFVRNGTILSHLMANANTSTFDSSADSMTINTATLNTVNTNIGTPGNFDSGGATLSDNLKKIADDNGGATFNATNDSLNKIRARGDSAWTSGASDAVTTTIASAASARSVTLTAGTPVVNAHRYMILTITDADDNTSIESRVITSWSAGLVAIVDEAFSFTPTNGDVATIAQASYFKPIQIP